MSGVTPLRVAIVGCGPKGLYALERLVARAQEGDPPPPLSVDVYEPHPHPGAGPVYDPGQPEYLRMNFAADMVDMWPAGSAMGEPFSIWRQSQADATDEPYPPRAHVGRYLAEGFRRVLTEAKELFEIQVRPVYVDLVRDEGESWDVISQDGAFAYDEVLLSSGHAGRWDGGLAATEDRPRRVIGSVFPVETQLPEAALPRGSIVSVRGFALTMIDAALAMTEGRGGSFRPGRETYLFSYEPGPADVGRILPYSRTGRPMLAKPDPAGAFASDRLDQIAAKGRAAIAGLPSDGAVEVVGAALARVAEESLRSVGGSEGEVQGIADTIGDAIAATARAPATSPADEIERSIAIGVGKGEPGAAWALGHGWRVLYPAIVDRLGADGLEPSEWPAFRRLAAEMERISFGPPPVNAAKLLALIECGKVDLTCLATGPSDEADVIVDAVIPPPGASAGQDGPAASLVRDRVVRTAHGRRGLELTSDLFCVGVHGRPQRGLTVIGRATEDWVIGNDTLNRSLHPHPDLWAQRVLERAVHP